MFSTKQKLLQKTGPDGIGRYDYLRLLKKEFEQTVQEDAKKQILANLANFSYDPINYEYIRSLQLIDLLLDQLRSVNPTLVHFALAALCNLSSDPINNNIIVFKNGIPLISQILLQNNDEELLLNAVTTLMFLLTEENRNEILTETVIQRIRNLKTEDRPRLMNICTIFLEDCVDENVSTVRTQETSF